MAHKWAKWLPHPCRIGDPHRFRAGGQNQKWPTSGQSGYLTPAVSGIPTASERGAKSEVAHKWAKWLPHPCRIGDPHRFRAGGQNQKWPTSGQNGYLTPAVLGIPTASERGGKIRSGPQVGKMATSPLPYWGSPPLQSGGARSEMAHKWAKWLPHPCRIGGSHRFRAGGKIRSGPQVGKVATSPLPYRGSPPLQSGGQNQKWPTSGQNGYLTLAVSGIPTASDRGGKIRSGPQVGKMATSPLPYWGSPPLQSGGQNQKWPTSGQSGYLTPAVSGIPTASERGAKSEVAHKWAKWLPHPCRIGDPHRFRAWGQNQKWPTSGQNGYLTPAVLGIPTASERGGKIRNGPQVGKMATTTLPYWGSPPLQSGGQNQKWPTSGQSGYLTPAVSGIPTALERGAKSEVAHKWAKWLPHPCRIGDPHRFRAGGKIRHGPQVGKVATSPLPYRGSPPLQSGGQNQKWPTSGQSGYLTPAVLGIPTASELGAKSEVAHKWAKWLPHPCRIGDPHRFRAGGKIRNGQQVGKMATSPLPYRGSPPLQSGGQNQKWPTTGQNGYLTPAVSGIPTASERGGKIRSGPQVGKMATSPLPYRGSPPLQSGGAKSEVAHKWAKWLPHPCRIGDPHRFRAGGKIRSGPQVGKVATSPLPYRGSPPLQSGGGKIRSGPQVGKMATSPLPYRGSPPLQSGGAKSEVAHKWAKWLPHPCHIGDPPRFRAGGQNEKWPTSGQNGYLTPAVSGIPTASERGAKSEVAHKWAKWLPHPCRIGDPHRFRAGGQNQKWPTSGQNGYLTPAVSGIPTASERGGKMRNGPQVGKMATSPLPYRGSPPLQSSGQNQKWPTSGQNGYLTPAVSGIPTASERGAKSEMANKWAKWLPHPCRIGDPHRFRAGGKIRSGPQLGKMATSPLPYRGSPPLQSGGAKSEVAHKWAKWLPHPCRIGDPHRFRAGGQNQKWPTSGQNGYLTPAVLGIPTASERGAKSEVAHKWAKWLPHPCRIGDPHRFRAGGAKSEVAHKWAKWLPHPCRIGDPHRFRAGGQNQKWPTSGQNGYLTPAILGIPPASERGGKMRNGPQVGKMATSPLPYRGSPPLQSGGQNQKWPTSGQNGYLTPAVSGIPTASERGGKIRSGPQVGKMATSPLPYRGSPPLQSVGAK